MRILFLLISSFLFFTSPVKSEVKILNAGSTSKWVDEQKLVDNVGIYDLHVIPTAQLARLGHRANSDAPHRPFFVGRYVDRLTHLEVPSSIIINKIFIRPYQYFIPIGLRLIFPKHYFW